MGACQGSEVILQLSKAEQVSGVGKGGGGADLRVCGQAWREPMRMPPISDPGAALLIPGTQDWLHNFQSQYKTEMWGPC